MAEISSLSELLRWTATVCKKMLPERVLRYVWPDRDILAAIEVFSFDQAPRFYVRAERGSPDLNVVGFNVFNLSPFRLSIVGADLRLSVDSSDWLTYSMRLPSEIPMPPFARSGFHFTRQLSDSHVQRLRNYPNDWLLLRVTGAIIVKSLFGELRKDIHADVVAIIDRT